MPMTFVPIADLGAALLSLLLHSLFWVVLAALVVGGMFWLLAVRDRGRAARLHDLAFGSAQSRAREPGARRFVRVSFGLLWIVNALLQARPKVPAGFIAQNIEPEVLSAPQWFGDAVGPLMRAWTRHPVVADAVFVWIQVGLGLLLLLGGRGLLARIAAVGSILWGLFGWIVVEAFGGLFAFGASWLSGAPGAALAYIVAAGALLAPWAWWDSGRMAVLLRRTTAGWFVLTAILQVLPGNGFWTAEGLSYPFASGEAAIPSVVFDEPIRALARISAGHPVPVNAAIVATLGALAIALWFSGRTVVVVAGFGLCLATWWLAQQFGARVSTATDPNSALPLALLLAAALPAWLVVRGAVDVRTDEPQRRPAHLALRAATVTVAVGLTLVLPVALSASLGAPADANAVTADSGGGIRAVPHRPASAFALTDQRGAATSTALLRGKLVVLTFLDPVCTTDCPLIANQLAVANREIGPLANQVEFVAIDTNPVFRFQSDVAAFTASHGLAGFSNWHFLWGPADTVQSVLANYAITISVPTVGMIQHNEGLYFITSDGRQAAYLDDAAGEQLTQSYAGQVRDEIRSLVK